MLCPNLSFIVVVSARTTAERATMHKPNNLLEEDVREELEWDPYLNDSRIVVKAHDGEVTLTGTVDTYSDLLEATDDTWTVGGVVSVDNELLVGLVGAAITDVDVALACDAALDADRFVPHGSVAATVVDGWVTLTGQVRRHFQRLAAKHAVGRVSGVLGITDEIAISGDPIPSDVADRINKAFERNAILDSSLIDVSNLDHTIYLDGTVTSGTAKREAENSAWAAPGVYEVVNRLVIIP
jgi:osmotically-inducible protein OsmY